MDRHFMSNELKREDEDDYYRQGSWLQQVFDFVGAPRPNVRADQASMQYPVFALAPRDMTVLDFTDTRSGEKVHVTPAFGLGRATIEDRDILLFAISLICPMTDGNPIDWSTARRIRFSLTDYYAFIGTEKSGTNQLKKVETALDRLKGTVIKTTLKTNEMRRVDAFNLLETYSITEPNERKRGRGNAIMIEVQLCEWIHNAVVAKRELLALDRGYFKLKPLERRLYELARKFCGRQPSWTIGHDRLLELVGSRQSRKHILAELRAIAGKNNMPGYKLEMLSSSLSVTARPRVAAAVTDTPYDEL